MWRGQKVMITPDAAAKGVIITWGPRHMRYPVEPEMSDAIIVSAHVELCLIKYSNFEYEGKTPK